MKKKYTVLIIPAGSGMAIAAIQMLKNVENIATITADVNPLAPGLYLADKSYIIPSFDDNTFEDKLQSLIQKENIDVIIPALDTILHYFSKHKKQFETLGVKILISDEQTIQITRDKWETYQKLKDRIPIPKSFKSTKDINIPFPLFIKPRDGSGSINAYKINNNKELIFYSKKVTNPIIQEYLSGKEYTVDCLTDMKGKLLLSITRVRLETKAGISVKGKIIHNEKLNYMAQQITNYLSFQGPFFFQAIEDDNGIPKLTEINARISGTMSLSSSSGVNIHKLAIQSLMGEQITIPKIKTNLYVSRYWKDIVLTENEFIQ